MLKKIGSIVLLFFLIVPCEAKILDKIVAVVNGEIITLYDLKKEVKKASLSGGVGINLNDKQVVKQFLSEMINRVLLKEEANRLGIKVSKFEVDNQLRQIINDSELTEQEFKDELKKQGITLEEFRKNLEDNIKINKLISYMVRSKIVVTDEDIKKYVQAHHLKFEKKQRVHILLCESQDKKSLEQIVVNKDNKISVPNSVKVLDIGYVALKGLQEKWKQELAGVKKGNLTPVFQVDGKYVRLFVKDRDIEDPLSNPKIKNKIKNEIYRAKLKKRYYDYINKLRSKAVIEIKI